MKHKEFKAKVNDWNYKLSIPKDVYDYKYIINIIPNFKIAKPDHLYKYLPLNNHTVDSITNSYLYLTHPDSFNDPFDSFRRILDNSDSNLELIYQRFFSHCGIVSMTRNDKNILMWGHYTDNKGITIKFRTDYIAQLMYGPYYMNYQKTIPNTQEYDLSLRFIIAMNTKSTLWKYEDEWRFLCINRHPMKMPKKYKKIDNLLKAERYLPYDVNEIEEITLGYKFVFEEKYDFKKDSILIESYNEHKCKILDYVIKRKIPLKLIDITNNKRFELVKKKIELEKLSDQQYIIKFAN